MRVCEREREGEREREREGEGEGEVGKECLFAAAQERESAPTPVGQK